MSMKNLTVEQKATIKKELVDIDIDKLYEQMLDECYPEIDIIGLKYSPSQCQKEIDPCAFRCGVNYYIDSLCEDNELIEIDNEYFDYNEVQEFLDGLESQD